MSCRGIFCRAGLLFPRDEVLQQASGAVLRHGAKDEEGRRGENEQQDEVPIPAVGSPRVHTPRLHVPQVQNPARHARTLNLRDCTRQGAYRKPLLCGYTPASSETALPPKAAKEHIIGMKSCESDTPRFPNLQPQACSGVDLFFSELFPIIRSLVKSKNPARNTSPDLSRTDPG